MVSVIKLTFYDYAVAFYLNLLCIRDYRDSKVLGNLRSYLCGIASPTQIAKASDKVRKGAGEKVTLDPAEAVDYIVGKLKEKHVI